MSIDIGIIFKIGAIGLLLTVVIQVLKKSDRDDIAMLVSIVGTVIALSLVINVVNDLFQSIKDIFLLY